MFTFRFSSVFIFYVGSVLVSFVYNITFIILFLTSFRFHIIQSLYLYNILIEYEIKYVHIRIYIYENNFTFKNFSFYSSINHLSYSSLFIRNYLFFTKLALSIPETKSCEII